MLMALGKFTFSLKTAAFSTMKKSYEYKWSSTETVGNAPVFQVLGKGVDKMDLDGVIYPNSFGNSWLQSLTNLVQPSSSQPIEDLKAIAESEKPQVLVDGNGKIHGFWVIKNIEETGSYFNKLGAPEKIEFKLSLEKYGEIASSNNILGGLKNAIL